MAKRTQVDVRRGSGYRSHREMRRKWQAVVSLFVLPMMAACGGSSVVGTDGGSDGSSPFPNPPVIPATLTIASTLAVPGSDCANNVGDGGSTCIQFTNAPNYTCQNFVDDPLSERT
jgi:hypothetical protein